MQLARNRSWRVPDVGDAAAHAGGEVAARGAEHDDAAAGHVLAAVVADAFDDRVGAAVAHGEPLGGAAAEQGRAAGGAVQAHVADDDVFLRDERGGPRRVDDEPAAAEALADVVVGVAFELQRDALGEEGAEALAGRAGELEVDRVVGQQVDAVPLGDLVAEDGADGAVGVDDRRARSRTRRPCSSAGFARSSSRVMSSDSSRPWSCFCVQYVPRFGVRLLGRRQQAGEVESVGLPVADGVVGLQAVDAADHLVDRAEAELGHDLASFLGDHEQVVDDVLRLAA